MRTRGDRRVAAVVEGVTVWEDERRERSASVRSQIVSFCVGFCGSGRRKRGAQVLRMTRPQSIAWLRRRDERGFWMPSTDYGHVGIVHTRARNVARRWGQIEL